jgi:hypothetical protein
MKRNQRMTFVLSCIGVIFAVSWMPFHLYLILTDVFIDLQVRSTLLHSSYEGATFSEDSRALLPKATYL